MQSNESNLALNQKAKHMSCLTYNTDTYDAEHIHEVTIDEKSIVFIIAIYFYIKKNIFHDLSYRSVYVVYTLPGNEENHFIYTQFFSGNYILFSNVLRRYLLRFSLKFNTV